MILFYSDVLVSEMGNRFSSFSRMRVVCTRKGCDLKACIQMPPSLFLPVVCV